MVTHCRKEEKRDGQDAQWSGMFSYLFTYKYYGSRCYE